MIRAQGGFALLIVLWSVVLLAVFATGLTAAGRSDLQLAGNIRRAAMAQAAADGGIAAAEFHLLDTATPWQADGAPHLLRIGGYTVITRVLDENRKLNPNFVEPAVMAALLRAVGSDPSRADALAQSIADWNERGPRDAVIQRYRSAGMAAAPTGAPFQSMADLGLVAGMTPDLLARVRPYLSVYATGEPNLAQADIIVQRALRSLPGAPSTQASAPATVPATVFDITAEARSPDGSGFERHAVAALGRRTAQRLFATLLWETGSGR